jgi:release factor glutamine methyltransferase
MKMDVIQLIREIKDDLIPCCSSEHEAEQQAWWLLEEISKKNETQLLFDNQIELTDSDKKTLDEWVSLRVSEKKPIQYILGYVEFCGLEFFVKQPTLIPRPETEEWVCWLLEKLKKVENEKLNILDIGCGSGCIAIALANNLKNSSVIGVDLSSAAIELSNQNREHNKIKNVSFIQSDFYSNLSPDLKFDLIVSNPPYISEKEWSDLSDTVKNWEDYKALVAKDNGLFAFEKIILDAKSYLKENIKLKELGVPQIVLEMGKGQQNEVKMVLLKNNFKNVQFFSDLEGVDRWVTGGF